MPGGKYDSSKTRVWPVFDTLWKRGRDWLPELLSLPTGGCRDAGIERRDFALLEGYWEPNERCLNPPVSLLSWLIRNVGTLNSASFEGALRQRLASGDPSAVDEALRLLRTEGATRAWYVFEGPTCPDVYLVACDALVVIEGKRTEATTTTDTTWLKGRHQIWRHLDAASEIRGNRAVYGFFIVESDANGTLPEHWRLAGASCLDPDALRSSFPHRSSAEIDAISRCFLGVTTWRHVCDRFEIDWRSLPHDTSGAND
jgi:hypothetical protein